MSAAILFAAWTLTVDQFFDSPPILRHVDAARAETTAGAHDASWEPADLAGWAEWLRCRSPSGPVFGWGVSRGSTNLIQSLAFGAPFTAIAAEAAGAGNIGRPYEFAGDKLGLSERSSRILLWPMIEATFWWIRVHDGFDMRAAKDGLTAIRGSRTSVLLLHGAADRGAPLAGVERLRAANPQHADLVVIPAVGHQWFSVAHTEVTRRVLAWFEAAPVIPPEGPAASVPR